MVEKWEWLKPASACVVERMAWLASPHMFIMTPEVVRSPGFRNFVERGRGGGGRGSGVPSMRIELCICNFVC